MNHSPLVAALPAGLLAALAVVSFSACPLEQVACTELAAFSVNVTLTDDSTDTPIDDATVTFSVDGGAAQDCENLGGGSYACGVEVEGDFVINASHPDYVAGEGSATVVKDEDGCHVVGESVALALTPIV